MRVVLDTHTLLWSLGSTSKLSQTATKAIVEADEALVSIGTLWEIAIKLSIKKLEMPITLEKLVDEYLPATSLSVLTIQVEHLKVIATLLLHHRDPFDRLIIAQAMVEKLPIVSADSAFDAYPIKRLW